jgi:hypothetical protein
MIYKQHLQVDSSGKKIRFAYRWGCRKDRKQNSGKHVGGVLYDQMYPK